MAEQPTNYGSVAEPAERSIAEPPPAEGEKELEEIYTDLGIGKAQYFIWATLVLVVSSDTSELIVISLLMPYLRCEWDLSLAFEVVISCSIFFCYALGGLLFGSLSDKIGRRTVILHSTTLLLVAGLTSAIAWNKWIFLGTRMVVGLCVGANYPTVMVFAFEITTSKYKETGAFIVLLFEKATVVVVALAAWLLLNTVGWRWFVVIATIPIFIALIMIILVPESPRYLVASGKREKAREVLRTMFQWNGKEFPEEVVIKTYEHVERGNIKDLTKPKYLKDTILLCVIYMGNIVIIFGLIIFLPLALSAGFCGVSQPATRHDCKALNQVNLRDIALITTAGVFGVVVATALARAVGRNYPIKGSSLLVFLGVASLFVCVNLLVTKITLFLIKLFVHICNTVLWIAIPECYPTTLRNTATGFINFWGKSAGAVATGLVYLLFYISPTLVISMFTGAALASTIAAMIWSRETKDERIADGEE